MTEEVKDENIITTEDLASALNGNFLDKIKEFAWRGKEAKLPEVPNEEMHSFEIFIRLGFLADPEDEGPLTFDKLGIYTFTCAPHTKKEVEEAVEKDKAQSSSDDS